MTSLLIRGGCLITPFQERLTDLWLDGPVIAGIGPAGRSADFQVIDAHGLYVTPGLVDLQVNGGPECDLWETASQEELAALRHRLARHGVTSFLPTLITAEIQHLKQAQKFLSDCGAGRTDIHRLKASDNGAHLLGIHLEGPCLSPKKPGVHPSAWLRPPSPALFEELLSQAVVLVTFAPELDPGGESLLYLQQRGIAVSIGHSNATFDEARQAFDRGIRLMTHAFNALPGIHHRQPGAVAAALLDKRVSVCLICDGLHVSEAVCELTVRLKGAGSTILVSDAAAVGTGSGGLVGSSISLGEAVKNIVSWGITDFREAVLMASWNAASAVGLEKDLAQIAPGKVADLVLWERQSLNIAHVIIAGRLIF